MQQEVVSRRRMIGCLLRQRGAQGFEATAVRTALVGGAQPHEIRLRQIQAAVVERRASALADHRRQGLVDRAPDRNRGVRDLPGFGAI